MDARTTVRCGAHRPAYSDSSFTGAVPMGKKFISSAKKAIRLLASAAKTARHLQAIVRLVSTLRDFL